MQKEKYVVTAEASLVAIQRLLSNGGVRAKAIKENYKPIFKDKEEYFKAATEINRDFEPITYNEDGSVTVRYK